MEVLHNEVEHRFFIEVEGHEAHVDYRIAEGGLDIRHTIVPEAIGGRGIASQLVRAAYDYAREQGLKPVATCSYAVKWLEKHPEYDGKCGKDYAGAGSCAL